MDRRAVLGLGAGAAAMVATRATGQTPTTLQWPAAEHFALWTGRPPGSPATLPVERRDGPDDGRELWMRGVARPTVSVFRPDRPNGIGILAIPGGGYGFVSVENEGVNVARALTPQGFTVFVLTYRLPGEGWADRADVPLQDAQRAMRMIRVRAASFGVDAAKLGLLGFSAGGHLGASLTVGHADRVYAPVDAADRLSARPDFAGLIYAVTTLSDGGKPSNSARNLLGDARDAPTLARYDTPARITRATPPLFLMQASDDPLVPVEMSLAALNAARAAGVAAEAHLYERGGHGFGMALDPTHPAHGWGDLFARWLLRHMAATD